MMIKPKLLYSRWVHSRYFFRKRFFVDGEPKRRRMVLNTAERSTVPMTTNCHSSLSVPNPTAVQLALHCYLSFLLNSLSPFILHGNEIRESTNLQILPTWGAGWRHSPALVINNKLRVCTPQRHICHSVTLKNNSHNNWQSCSELWQRNMH